MTFPTAFRVASDSRLNAAQPQNFHQFKRHAPRNFYRQPSRVRPGDQRTEGSHRTAFQPCAVASKRPSAERLRKGAGDSCEAVMSIKSMSRRVVVENLLEACRRADSSRVTSRGGRQGILSGLSGVLMKSSPLLLGRGTLTILVRLSGIRSGGRRTPTWDV